jgi:hypothetical protein
MIAPVTSRRRDWRCTSSTNPLCLPVASIVHKLSVGVHERCRQPFQRRRVIHSEADCNSRTFDTPNWKKSTQREQLYNVRAAAAGGRWFGDGTAAEQSKRAAEDRCRGQHAAWLRWARPAFPATIATTTTVSTTAHAFRSAHAPRGADGFRRLLRSADKQLDVAHVPFGSAAG